MFENMKVFAGYWGFKFVNLQPTPLSNSIIMNDILFKFKTYTYAGWR